VDVGRQVGKQEYCRDNVRQGIEPNGKDDGIATESLKLLLD
jgi:hypothetical protein